MVKKKAVTENKFTEDEFIFLVKLLEKKRTCCGWVIENKDDDIAVSKAKKSDGILSSVLEKLELMREKIVS